MSLTRTQIKTEDQLIEIISPMLLPLGYELVSVEVHTHGTRALRLFIDHAGKSEQTIGIEDCVKVTREISEKLDQIEIINSLFPNHYELEVSSPGLDRPLRRTKDFERFSGKKIRIHTYRPLTPEEAENTEYLSTHAKQKNFLGVLIGIKDQKVMIEFPEHSTSISIPLPLVSKANLEPELDWNQVNKKKERKSL